MKSTDKIELVETHSIAKSLNRLSSGSGGYDSERAKRALYHALAMTYVLSHSEIKAIREALQLP